MMFESHTFFLAATAFIVGVLSAALPKLLLNQREILEQLSALHDAMNGKMERLLHEYGRAERAAGITQEREAERERRVHDE